MVADGAGTYDLANVVEIPDSRLFGGPEGFVYVPSGSPQFSGPSLLVSEYGVDEIAAYQVDGNGDPVVATRREFITGLDGAEGALLDPVTGDYLFSTFGGGSRVIVVRGFRAPPPQLPPPEAGKTVNAFVVRGTVRIKRGNKFVVLAAGEQIPVGATLDTTKGRVTIVAAGDQQADFYDGIFKIGQGKGAKPLTTLTLVEKLRCPRGGQGEHRRQAQEEAQALGRRQRQLQDPGQAQRGHRGRHQVARRGPLQEHADQGGDRRGLGARLRQAQDRAGQGWQEVRGEGPAPLGEELHSACRVVSCQDPGITEVGITEAKRTLPHLIERARAGEDIVITRRRRPVARLVPVARPNTFASIHGIWRGRVPWPTISTNCLTTSPRPSACVDILVGWSVDIAAAVQGRSQACGNGTESGWGSSAWRSPRRSPCRRLRSLPRRRRRR